MKPKNETKNKYKIENNYKADLKEKSNKYF